MLTRAALVGKMSRWYTTSHGYYVYHHAVDPTLLAQAEPNNKANENLCFPLQAFSGRAWTTMVRKCFPMNASSAESIYVYGSNTPGILYRIEVQFAGDSTNAAAISSWYYFRFTS
jgi:hypothetical protein